jgi:hypothetical protein
MISPIYAGRIIFHPAPLIAPLLNACCPPHIAGAVVTIIVNSIDRQFRKRTMSYICEKTFERMRAVLAKSPAVAN